ncbi:MAG: SDR family NAD(P)-dependent oxidoreductase, partial [Duncaniella sp.]|nr:SDR family NAD(P)-dependent oxidoreductase [Duncaniella sp.]
VASAFRFFENQGMPGTIAAITSVAGTRGIGEMPAYSASKRYQSNYIDALEQLAVSKGLDISFCDIRPGWTRTPLLDPDRKYFMSMSERKVVISTVKALIRSRRVAVIDGRWRMLCAVWRRVPRCLWPHIDFHSQEVR